MDLYSSAEVAEVLGVGERDVERWVRSRLVAPSEQRGRRRLFTFADLVAAKAAKELLGRGASVRTVRKNLDALRAALPSVDRPLARLRVVSDGERLVVLHADRVFEPLSGQVVMEFVVDALSARAAEVHALPRVAVRPPSGRSPLQVPAHIPLKAHAGGERASRTGWDWFGHGLALDEAGRDAEAEEAYRAAIVLDPALAAAHNNLGRLAHRAGRRGETREHFERALAVDADQPEARYNLGNLLAELGDLAGACEAWTRAAAHAPPVGDAWFNLAVCEARAGRTLSARAHLERYFAVAEDASDEARALRDELADADRTAIRARAASQ